MYLRRKSLFLNNLVFLKRRNLALIFCVVFGLRINAQIGNFVNNGSFEEKYNCQPPYYLNKAKFWNNIGIDTNSLSGYLLCVDTNCFKNAPSIPFIGYQYPYFGKTFARMGFYCTNPCQYIYSRGYPKNRLKEHLEAKKTYCVKMYIVRQEASPYAVSNIGFYFGNETTDTIQLANAPITYLYPQVKNPSNNIISDTLNWTPITGTFVADGTEKYLIIGNFDSNAATTYSLVDTSFGNGVWAEYFIDAISCMEVNLPAYAGPDKSILPGDSVYIGRESDFAIDPGCIWYKLPNTTTAIDTSSGIWVKPTTTSTYVVKQTLDCSPEKWDTVVVYMDLVGIEKYQRLSENITLIPNPASDYFELKFTLNEIRNFSQLKIYNSLGQLIRKEDVDLKVDSKINIQDLINGIYTLTLSNNDSEAITKKLIVSR